MLKDGVIAPERLVDITRLPLHGITRSDDTLRVAALTTMEELAADPTVAERLPLVREALLAGASVQLHNMATIGGNLLQRTRCRYFRDPAVAACNKRTPGSGCAAVAGPARMHAILGATQDCIAAHASDLCVPLVALDAVVHIQGVGGRRSVPLTEFYVLPGDRPDVENVLEHGELITQVDVPLLPGPCTVGLPEGARPRLVRVRPHLRGGGAADRGRHDRGGAPRARRRRDDPVAGARG
jgi:xanthine dehydrogenase YagS FAD-binding subunit